MLNIKRINPFNKIHLNFLYSTRFNSDVVKTLLASETPSFEKHVKYIQSKDTAGHLFFLCHVEDTLVGYCQCFSIGENVWELGWVIHPDCQNKGYGKQSVQLLLDEVSAMGGVAAELVVLKENVRAFSIYARSNFEVVEDLGDSYRMRLKLLRSNL